MSVKATLNHYSGLAAEASVTREYLGRGYDLLEQRWRGRGGEIDLIFAKNAQIVFVEVKKSRSLDAALARITERQIARIAISVEEYLATTPDGLLTDTRFDVALVGQDGRIRVIENALWQ